MRHAWGERKNDDDRTAKFCAVVIGGAVLYFGIHLLVWVIKGCPVAG